MHFKSEYRDYPVVLRTQWDRLSQLTKTHYDVYDVQEDEDDKAILLITKDTEAQVEFYIDGRIKRLKTTKLPDAIPVIVRAYDKGAYRYLDGKSKGRRTSGSYYSIYVTVPEKRNTKTYSPCEILEDTPENRTMIKEIELLSAKLKGLVAKRDGLKECMKIEKFKQFNI